MVRCLFDLPRCAFFVFLFFFFYGSLLHSLSTTRQDKNNGRMDRLRKPKFPKVLLICPCSAQSNEEVLSKLNDQNTLYPLSSLHFCPECSSIKCRRCLEIRIVAKYCPHCKYPMKYEHSYCSRNCFLCPLCKVSLSITSNDEKDDRGNLKGKRFKFTCPRDHYEYDTGLIEKPKSLARILKSQLRSNFSELQQFDNLMDHYLTTREVLKYQEKKSDLRASRRSSPVKRERISNFQSPAIPSIDLAKFSVDGVVPVFEASVENLSVDVEMAVVASKSEFCQRDVGPDFHHPVEEVIHPKGTKTPPLGQPLKGKVNLNCRDCEHSIIKSDSDPLSSKFIANFIATDVVPEIRISKLFNQQEEGDVFSKRDINLLISFINPNPVSAELSISSFDKVLISTGDSADKSYAQMNLPCSAFKLGSQPEKLSKLESIIKTIPTVELNDSSLLSRAEMMARSGVIGRIDKPLPSNTNNKPLDLGINWCTLPLNIKLFGSYVPETVLRIPFFISVKSTTNDYGFWMVAELGRICLDDDA